VISDLAEVRDARFPVFARGVVPVAGVKAATAPLNEPVRCGGLIVRAGDIVVADDDGVLVVPAELRKQAARDGRAKAEAEAAQTLDMWEVAHHARIDSILIEQGFSSARITEAGQ
jgi:4-hydroxy-4-methyl-2-oxoglutarate aldolase